MAGGINEFLGRQEDRSRGECNTDTFLSIYLYSVYRGGRKYACHYEWSGWLCHWQKMLGVCGDAQGDLLSTRYREVVKAICFEGLISPTGDNAFSDLIKTIRMIWLLDQAASKR